MRHKIIVCISVGIAVATANVLNTFDQRQLDSLAVSLNEENYFDLNKAVARDQFISSLTLSGILVHGQVKDDIDSAIDELVFSSIQKAVNSDAAFPKIYTLDGPPKVGSVNNSVPGGRYSYDNPDCIYRTIPISSSYEYVIHGRRSKNQPTDSTFSLIGNPNSQQTIDAIYADQLVVEPNGTFKITVSSKKSQSPNHLVSTDSVTQLFVRNNIGDWNLETADELSVSIISNVSNVEPLSRETIIQRANENILESSFFYGFGALGVETLSHPVNVLASPQQSSTLGTLTSQAQSFGHYSLPEDKSLVITISSGKASYWVIPITSVRLITTTPWQSLVSLNSKQAVANDNGTYTIVISQRDPGVYNWINITSRPIGTFMGRWQGLSPSGDEKSSIQVNSNVVNFDELRGFLPNNTRYVNKQERQLQVRKRTAGYKRIHEI